MRNRSAEREFYTQFRIAREYALASWPKLVQYYKALERQHLPGRRQSERDASATSSAFTRSRAAAARLTSRPDQPERGPEATSTPSREGSMAMPGTMQLPGLFFGFNENGVRAACETRAHDE
jgi:hypothetical protein